MNRFERRKTEPARRAMLPILVGSLLMLFTVEAGANPLAGSEVGAIRAVRTQQPSDLVRLDCDALQRDRGLRNSMLPSKRRALIDACRARESAIVVAGGDPPPLPPSLAD